MNPETVVLEFCLSIYEAYEISDSHSDADEEFRLHGCETVQTDKCVAMFRRSFLPHYSWQSDVFVSAGFVSQLGNGLSWLRLFV
jgi:hypothetical protein